MSGGIQKHIKTLRRMTGVAVEVGWLHGDTYPNGKTVAEVMEMNEFGMGELPMRPVLRQSREVFNRQVGTFIHKLTAQVLDSGGSPDDIPEAMGELFVDIVRNEIDSSAFVANKASTIKRKGFNHPLYETGLAYETVSYKVIKK